MSKAVMERVEKKGNRSEQSIKKYDENWPVMKLGEVAEVQSGGTPLVSNKTFWNGNIPWYSSGELNDMFTCDPERHVSMAGLENSNAKLFPTGSLLIGMYDTAALKMSILDRDGSFNQAIAGVKPSNKISMSYLLNAINANREFILDQRRGVRQKNLSLGKIKEIEIQIPPLPEQHRIVRILDEAFEAIAAAKANAEKNLQNARALFESHLHSVFSQRGDEWEERKKPLADLCEFIVDCEHKTAPTQDDGIPSIRTPNIGKGKLLLEGVYRVSEKTYQEWTRRAEPRFGDLILAREAPAGNVAVIPEKTRVCLGQRTVLIRPNKEIFNSHFLAYLLLQPEMQGKLLAHSRGATVQHVNMKDIRAIHVGAIPTVSIQSKIVERIKQASSEGENLVELNQRKLTALDALKKSLLSQAFSGNI